MQNKFKKIIFDFAYKTSNLTHCDGNCRPFVTYHNPPHEKIILRIVWKLRSDGPMWSVLWKVLKMTLLLEYEIFQICPSPRPGRWGSELVRRPNEGHPRSVNDLLWTAGPSRTFRRTIRRSGITTSCLCVYVQSIYLRFM